ncbi:MAG TPA: hypothetical protein PLG15_01560 [Candidatus Gastranaerophilaceae bacterium]|nr:hypothetical protein [Candidatus Gastranaerophilaceae bacterium]HPT41054.1 hypothetical protein [Candidatus Gastranaerophilaceae bacterium]
MKKILIFLAAFLMFQTACFAQTGITFLYINGSNNNDAKMKNWYERGVKKLHPHMKREFESNKLTQEYFLKNGEYFIEQQPAIFFWGDKSHRDLAFVESDLNISKTFSPWIAYQIRFALTRFLHDAIWVQKYHNMLPVVEDLHKMVVSENEKGNKVVLYGYSAGSFVTYEYMLTRLPFIETVDFFNNVDVTPAQREFVAKHPMKNTCMRALGEDLAVFSAAGHIVPNKNDSLFKEKYMNLNNLTDQVCTPDNSLKGVVNFASPLVLFYSDISDPNYQITYYNRLLLEYLIENDMFWLTVNYREDPLGFPCGRNLSIEEMEEIAKLDIEPHAGFVYDKSNTRGTRGVFMAHTSYWSTGKVFSKAVVNAYVNGYTNRKKKAE